MSFFPSIPLSYRKTKDVECTLVGATFATLIVAIELAKAGFSVQILEQHPCLGFGDTGKTLLPASMSFTDNLFRLNTSLGRENCQLLYNVMQLGLEYLQNNQLLRGKKSLEIAMNTAEQRELQESLQLMSQMSLPSSSQKYSEEDTIQLIISFVLCHSDQGYIEGYEVFSHLLEEATKQNISIIPNINCFI